MNEEYKETDWPFKWKWDKEEISITIPPKVFWWIIVALVVIAILK